MKTPQRTSTALITNQQSGRSLALTSGAYAVLFVAWLAFQLFK